MIIRGGLVRNSDRSALRLLHYWWPLALGWSLTVVVQRATGRAADPYGVATLLSGIFAAYSLDRVLDPPGTDGRGWMTQMLASAGIMSAIVCALAASRMPIRTAALVPALGAASLLYPALKQHPATKTVVLPAIWTWASIALPFNDGSWLGWHAVLQPVAVPLLLLIASGCLLCDLKDEAGDRQAGVRSLPAMFGGPATLRVAVTLAAASAAVALIEHRTGLAVSAAALGAATCSPTLLATEAAGPLLVDVILTLPGILISARVV
jgi:4-hydroxybenzoate polyprenyltransferase